jgi:ethanolamine ammonia-lyase large subunit
MDPELENQVRHLYSDAKKSIWMELPESFAGSIPGAILLNTRSADRKDYVYHPESGEKLSAGSVGILQNLRKKKSEKISGVQIIISDGLCPDSLTDDGHLEPFLDTLKNELKSAGIEADENILVIRSGRVRAGYSCGEYLFGNTAVPGREHGIIHIIGERPGSGHHSFSAYLTVASAAKWSEKGVVDHDITRVVSGISDTSILPEEAARESVKILKKLFS